MTGSSTPGCGPRWAADLRDDPDLQATIKTAIEDVNRTVSAAEGIKRSRIVTDPFVVGDDLTPSQKIRRNHVLVNRADDIDALYE